jgi:hypothetical protein
MTEPIDPFNTARSNFIGLGDLSGRAVLVYPLELQTGIVSTRDASKTYDRIVADVIVLDGGLDEETGIEEVPTTVEAMYISGAVLVPQLRGALRNKRPVLGVVDKQKSRTKGNQDAVVLSGDVTEEQRQLARKAWQDYQAAQVDPFATADA